MNFEFGRWITGVSLVSFRIADVYDVPHHHHSPIHLESSLIDASEKEFTIRSNKK
jgi:hypothetical protein